MKPLTKLLLISISRTFFLSAHCKSWNSFQSNNNFYDFIYVNESHLKMVCKLDDIRKWIRILFMSIKFEDRREICFEMHTHTHTHTKRNEETETTNSWMHSIYINFYGNWNETERRWKKKKLGKITYNRTIETVVIV